MSVKMVNEDYEPSRKEDAVLDVLKDGRGADEPWGRANPLYLRKQTDLDKGDVEYALRNLRTAGWVEQLTEGLYEFVDDPRE